MPNLRIILEKLVKNIQPGDLTDYRKEMIEDAEQKIKELMLDEDEIFIFINTGRADKNENKVRGYVEGRYVEKIASAIHSAMRIDEIRLRELWGVLYTQESFENKSLDAGLGNAYVNLIASHAQEIIKFEEE